MNTPDIEIYVKNLNSKELLSWLSNNFSIVNLNLEQKDLESDKTISGLVFKTENENSAIPIQITPKAAGKSYTSIWFKSAATGWENDQCCGTDFFEFCGLEVRCSTGSWQENEEEGSEQWLSISKEGKRLIAW